MTLAAVWRGGGSVALEQFPLPEPGDGEVLVRVRLATVCGSDRHTVKGRRSQPCPSVLGHEAVGTVESVGSSGAADVDGSPLVRGQRVIWSVTVPCRRCDRCLAGFTAKCRRLRKAGHEALDSGWALSGSYAEHVLLPAGTPVAVVPDEVPDAVAAPAACATATVMAVVERAGPLAGRRVGVLGAGMLGLTAACAAADAAAASVDVVDLDPARLGLARRFGATRGYAAVPADAQWDVLLEFAGASGPLGLALDRLDTQGTAILAGSVAPDDPVPLDPETVVRRQLTIAGVHNYEPRHLGAALDFLARTSRTRPWADLVDPPLPLARIAELLTGPSGSNPRASVVP